jgi:hypothetical protein
MRVHALFLTILAGCIAAATAGESVVAPKDTGPPVPSVTPVFSQLVAFSIPREFTQALDEKSATAHLREFVLKGENADKWSQKITLTGTRGAATDTQSSSLTILQALAGRFQRRCPTSFVVKPVGIVPAGASEGFAAILGCGTVKPGTPASEIAIVVAARGSADDYIIQWAERGPATDQPPVLDEAKWKSRFDQLLPIRVCDPVPNEAAPYPSCSR